MSDPAQRTPRSPRARHGDARGARQRQRPRLFAFDRRLGVRFVAGADEAGRGCLAGPLVAAGVLFDYDALTTRELRALSALNDSKQHTHEAREELYPLVLRSAARVVVVSRCVRGIDARGLHKTNLAALRDALRGVTAVWPMTCCAWWTASPWRSSSARSARSSTAMPPARRSRRRRSSRR